MSNTYYSIEFILGIINQFNRAMKTERKTTYATIASANEVSEKQVAAWINGSRVITNYHEIADKVTYKLSEPTNYFGWTLRYNMELDRSSINENTVFITDECGNHITGYTDIYYKNGNNSFSIKPIKPYDYDAIYYLYTTKDLRAINSMNCKPLKMQFKLIKETMKYEIKFINEAEDIHLSMDNYREVIKEKTKIP